MGRKSRLSEAQKAEIQRRLLAGESVRSVARDMNLPETTVRDNKSAHVAKIKDVAGQIVATENALRDLPIDARKEAHSFATRLLELQDNTLGAAANGMAVSHRLSGISRLLVEQIDDADPTESLAALKSIAALMRVSNDAAHIGLNLLSANKDALQAGGQSERPFIRLVNDPDAD